MTSRANTAPELQTTGLDRPVGRAPFLVWPVARREIYFSISFTLILPLLWGLLIFGWRALMLLLTTLLTATLVYRLLKRFTRRGQHLLFAHTLVSTLLLVALSNALWPPLYVALAAALMVGLIWAFGGPGHEPAHASILTVLALTLFLGHYAAAPEPSRADHGPILARDRLFMGDLAQSAPKRIHDWPRAVEIGGQDAVELSRPSVVTTELLREIPLHVRHIREAAAAPIQEFVHALTRVPGQPALPPEPIEDALDRLADSLRQSAGLASPPLPSPPATAPATTRATEPKSRWTLLAHAIAAHDQNPQVIRASAQVLVDYFTRQWVQQTLDDAVLHRLAPLEAILMGLRPGAIGAVFILGIIAAGLYLAYRNILRPYSCALFLASTILGLLVAAFLTRVSVAGVDFFHFWTILSPGETMVLLSYDVLSGDILFAAVFILALPGSEPLTPRARHVFLITAGLLAGMLHRADILVPPTIIILLAFQPLAPMFDRLFPRHPWLKSSSPPAAT